MADSVYTQQEVALILFLEWLDSEGHVAKFGDAYTTHEEAARRYLAEVHPATECDHTCCDELSGPDHDHWLRPAQCCAEASHA